MKRRHFIAYLGGAAISLGATGAGVDAHSANIGGMPNTHYVWKTSHRARGDLATHAGYFLIS
jgi:hypothetical protein